AWLVLAMVGALALFHPNRAAAQCCACFLCAADNFCVDDIAGQVACATLCNNAGCPNFAFEDGDICMGGCAGQPDFPTPTPPRPARGPGDSPADPPPGPPPPRPAPPPPPRPAPPPRRPPPPRPPPPPRRTPPGHCHTAPDEQPARPRDGHRHIDTDQQSTRH